MITAMTIRGKTTPTSNAGSFAAHTRPESDAELPNSSSITAVVERLRPDLELLADYDRGDVTVADPIFADAARILLDGVQARPGHAGRVGAVGAAGAHLARSGIDVGQHTLALAVLLITASGEDERPEMAGVIAAMLAGGHTRA